MPSYISAWVWLSKIYLRWKSINLIVSDLNSWILLNPVEECWKSCRWMEGPSSRCTSSSMNSNLCHNISFSDDDCVVKKKIIFRNLKTKIRLVEWPIIEHKTMRVFGRFYGDSRFIVFFQDILKYISILILSTSFIEFDKSCAYAF